MSSVELTPDEVAAAAARISGHRVLHVERVAGSVGNQDFLVATAGGDLVLKASSVQDLVPEVWACERVRRAGVNAPEILWFEAEPQSLPMPFLVMRRLPGAPVEVTSTALVAAGHQLARVHAIRLEAYGALAVSGGHARGTAAHWSAHLAHLVSGLDDLVAAGVLDEGTAARATLTLARSTDETRFDGPAVLLHGDLKPAHVLATDADEVAIIDWGDACAGDPRLDLARLSMAGPTALAAVLSGYGLPLTAELGRTFACYRMVWNLDALAYEFRAGGDWFQPYRAGVEAAVTELA